MDGENAHNLDSRTGAGSPRAAPGFESPRYDRALHYLAVLTTLATFPLIFMGGLVTSHHAGMSVPDWPNSYGYNMFLFPPHLWVGGIFYEHTHRLMGSIVGLLSLALAAYAWRHECFALLNHDWRSFRATPAPSAPGAVESLAESGRAVPAGIAETQSGPRVARSAARPERSVQYLCLAVLGAVIFQGVLGGLRVVLVKLDLAIVHACVAQAFFCLAALTAVVTSKWWMALPSPGLRTNSVLATRPSSPPTAAVEAGSHRGLIVLASCAVLAVFFQLIVGAAMRHNDAGLAIPDLPLAYGKVLPPLTSAQLEQVNHDRAWNLNLDPVTLGQVWLHFGHRAGALVVFILLTALILRIFRRHRRSPLTAPAVAISVLLPLQIALGSFTVLLRKPADVASAHVAVGALVLLAAWLVLVLSVRLYRRSSRGLKPRYNPSSGHFPVVRSIVPG